MSALVVFENGRWLRIVQDEVIAWGEAVGDALPVQEDETVVGVVPGDDIVVRHMALPDLAELQANAAGRLIAGEASAVPVEALHIATGLPDAEGMRDVVTVEAARVTQRLVDLARLGLDPDHLLAAPLMLPRPVQGFVIGDLGGGAVIRGRDTAFSDDPALTPLLTEGQVLLALDRASIEQGVVAAVAHPWPDLRSGVFAKRRRWPLDAQRLRQLARLALIWGVLVLASQLVAVVRLNAQASRLETGSRVLAASILPPGTVVTDPVVQVQAHLASVQGAGGGMRPLAVALVSAVDAVPGADLSSMTFDATGTLRATVRGSTPADLDAVTARLTSAGYGSVDGPIVPGPGKPYRDVVVRAK